MKISQTGMDNRLKPLKIPAGEVPHAVIESNYTCNRRCKVCYNQYRQGVKGIEEIREEIDQALRIRRLETISILGGEPTLHPQLPLIVRSVKEKGLYCQILTNGLVLLRDSKNILLDALLEAGLDRIILHVDRGQGLDGEEIHRMCSSLFSRFENRRIYFALSITLYDENREDIPVLMRRYAHFRYFDGILASVARPAVEIGHPAAPSNMKRDLECVYESIRNGLGIEPSSYVPSSLDDGEIRWLMYFYYLNAFTGMTAPVSPLFTRILRRAYRRLYGRHLFAATMKASLFPVWFLATAALETVLWPASIIQFAQIAVKSGGLKNLRFHYIVVQSPPVLDTENNRLEICYHCPDATIRNGRLVPVCLADRISPPSGAEFPAPGDDVLGAGVYNHLEVK